MCLRTLTEVDFKLLNELKWNFTISAKGNGKKLPFTVEWSKFQPLTIQAIAAMSNTQKWQVF